MQVLGQSNGHEALLSPHCGWHWPLPQTQTSWQSKQVWGVSPHCGWQTPLPQTQGLQSVPQVNTSSPQPGWQRPSPQKHC
jgi:hypothetical protein